jgi:hypothetical protein
MLATLTALLLAATPPLERGALVFMQVESPTDKEATALLEESLRHAFSTRMKVITCKEAIQDETALKKVLEDRGIKSSADAPKKVGLLTDFSRYGCEIPSEGPLWAAWLTAYADSRSKRREVSLRMRNLRDEKSIPTFASLAEPEDRRLSWSELVERCVHRYFGDERAAEAEIASTARVRVRDPLALSARFAFSHVKEAQDLAVAWSLYQCSERAVCDQFRAAVDEYVQCRRANRSRSTSDPSLRPVCVNPLESYDRVGVTKRSHFQPGLGPLAGATTWVHWLKDQATTLTVDIPGEYVLVTSAPWFLALGAGAASSADQDQADGFVAGAQRLTVEPPQDIAAVFVGAAWRPKFDLFGMVSYHRVLAQVSWVTLAVGGEWGIRLGSEQSRPPPFGARGLLSPSLLARRHWTAEIISEVWVAPAGLLYEFSQEGGYVPFLGSMLGLAVVYHPRWLPALNVRGGLMGVSKTLEPGHSEIYGPLVGFTLEI